MLSMQAAFNSCTSRMNSEVSPITEHVSLPNGSRFVAQFYSPVQPPRASVLLPGAMGVAQRYYAFFAQWLASLGFAAATFDYRGIGQSAPRSLRACHVDILDWAHGETATMLAALKQRAPDRPLFVVGHSLGAQLVGMIPNRQLIDGVVIVASGSGYWRTTSPPTRRNSLLMWRVLAPTLTPLFGYFPGKRIGAVGDLPRGVVNQWRRWCLHPEYMLSEEHLGLRQQFADVRTPMLSLSFTDDEMMSAHSTEALHRFYANAPIEHRRFAPIDTDAERIGHFGFFRPEFQHNLWPLAAQWMEAHV
jgi:predicted alpha/beta hydrolase